MSEKKITYCKDYYESREKYNEYIKNHIKAVNEAYETAEKAFKAVFPKVYEDPDQLMSLQCNLQYHDKSKNNYNEFWAYAMKFFPFEEIPSELEKFKDGFDIAWLHHANHNPHHPAYWTLVEDGKIQYFDMPDIYIIEMLCDWMAMSKYYNSTTLDFWFNNPSAKKLPMTLNTKMKITHFMGWMYKNNVHTLW